MKFIISFALGLFMCAFFTSSVKAQITSAASKINPKDTVPVSLVEQRFNEVYERNIRKTRINGVYIPKDLEDAFAELEALANPKSLDKFKSVEAEFVVNRLHYGLGRWIIVNWNFYEGSRISHHLKTYGVSHPDDQARFVLFAFHNHLNKKDIDPKGIADKLIKERKKILRERTIK